MLQELARDIRHAARVLGRRPVFTAVAVVTLSLGIAGNAAIFSMVQAMLLRPLPYPDPAALVQMGESVSATDHAMGATSRTTYLDWTHDNPTIASSGAYLHYPGFGLTLTGRGAPAQLEIGFATPDLFTTLGVGAALGRTFTAAEGGKQGADVVLLSDRLWRGRFGADPAVLGATAMLEGAPYTIVGVMPAGFAFPSAGVDAWVPLGLGAGDESGRASREIAVIARLRQGVTLEEATTEIDAITSMLNLDHAETMQGRVAVVMPLSEVTAGPVRPALLALLGAVGFVLLIACANVANLLLASLAARRQELAVRAALGAGRGRLLRQLLVETTLLGLAGAAAGSLLAFWLLEGLRGVAPRELQWLARVRLDAPALLATLALALLASLLVGLIPAIQALSPRALESLRQGGRIVSDPARRRARAAFLVSEVALSFALLVGAGLMIRSLAALNDVKAGFDDRRILTVRVKLAADRMDTAAQLRFFDAGVAAAATTPGVEAAGATSELPMAGFRQGRDWFIEGRDTGKPGDRAQLATRFVHPGYFDVMGIPLLEGRAFGERDVAGSPPVVLVSRAVARRFWPDRSPVGARVSFEGPEGPWREVVGVVGDTREFGLENPAAPIVYSPMRQRDAPQAWMSWMTFVVRTSGPPARVAPELRDRLQRLDPDLALDDVRPMTAVLAGARAARRFNTLLLGLFAGVALLLATVGIYGVVSLSVGARCREIGIRMALGARRAAILALVLKEGMGLTLAGVLAGVLLALGVTRFLASLLFGVTPTDAPTFASIAAFFGAVALLACWVPARRASRVDPTVALRSE
ncbi:MAG TPA: ABC transporter permease [Candidatus Polarisedimenticolia bacterium]|nr:ABC transporter permease [Candidatus Polarisedimenticolia bacterium]